MKFWSFINLPWGHVRSKKKFGPDGFSRFDVYRIQTNKQTPRQAKYIYRLTWREEQDEARMLEEKGVNAGGEKKPGKRETHLAWTGFRFEKSVRN